MARLASFHDTPRAKDLANQIASLENRCWPSPADQRLAAELREIQAREAWQFANPGNSGRLAQLSSSARQTRRPVTTMATTRTRTKKVEAKAATVAPVPTDAGTLYLRTVDRDGRAYGGFQWPSEIGSVVTAPDYRPRPICGYGLHGLPWGQGNLGLLSEDDDAVWQVVGHAVDPIDIDHEKSKFRTCTLLYSGDKAGAISFMAASCPSGVALPWGTATAGYRGTATAGDWGTATAGYSGTATAGYSGTATAGDRGTATAGDSGTATAGDRGTATAGYSGTATAGDSGTATAGDRGTATAGDRGTATAGYRGTATAGDWGTATAGYSGTATAGDSGTATAGDRGTVSGSDNSILVVKWWDEAAERYRLVVGYVGEDGIEPGKRYRVGENAKLVEVA